MSPGATVQTGTGKVDPALKFKCTTAPRDISNFILVIECSSLIVIFVTKEDAIECNFFITYKY